MSAFAVVSRPPEELDPGGRICSRGGGIMVCLWLLDLGLVLVAILLGHLVITFCCCDWIMEVSSRGIQETKGTFSMLKGESVMVPEWFP